MNPISQYCWRAFGGQHLFCSQRWIVAPDCLRFLARLQVVAPLFIAIAVAILARCHNIGGILLSDDETYSWRITQYGVKDLIQRSARDAHPPGYYLTLKIWEGFWGSSPGALRSMSVLFGALSVLGIYILCLEACPKREGRSQQIPNSAHLGALLSALLMALHVSQITPGRTARMYSMGAFLATLTAWLLLRAMRSARHREVWWSVYGVAVAVFCYTHFWQSFSWKRARLPKNTRLTR